MANWRLGIVAGLYVAAAGPAWAQTAAGTPQPAPPAVDGTTVVVQGKRNEVTDRIDRRVYDVKNDPDSQTGTAGDVLNKLPSVTVNPAGRVTLRGDPSVTVLIDGKPPVNNFTETLAASDIDRIEVITNPSAQYAAEGTGGIINIITQKRHPFGLSGTITGRATSIGEVNGNGTMSLTKGAWSLTARLNGGIFPGTDRWASQETFPASVSSGNRDRYVTNFGGGAVEVSRKIGDHQTLTLNSAYNAFWSNDKASAYYQSDSRDFTTRAETDYGHHFARNGLIYDNNNDTTGHHYTLDASFGTGGSYNRTLTTDTYTRPSTGQAIYGVNDRGTKTGDDIKFDFESHASAGRILTAGMEWTRDGLDQIDLYSDAGAIAGPYINGGTHALFGQRDLTAAYVTYQHPLFGGWTMLPGLRVEYEALDIRSAGVAAKTDDLNLYPTLHLSHDFGKGKIKLSYSRRVDRPKFAQLDPTRLYQSAVYATEGDPTLKSPTTDSWEFGYEHSQGNVSTDATLYYRALTHAVSDLYQDLGNGVTLDRQVNSGHNRSAGSEFTVKRPVSKHWKVSFNLDAFYSEVPLVTVIGPEKSRGTVTYVSNSSIEYDADQGDQLQLNLGLTGRQLTVQGYNSGTSHLDLTWRHNLNKRLALVVGGTDILLGQRVVTVYNTPELLSRGVQAATDRALRIGLTQTFGGAGK